MAEFCRAQGRYAEAEPLYKRALEKARAADDLATILNNLATAYEAQGRDAEAEPLAMVEILEKKALVLVPNAPALAARARIMAETLENYAALLREAGRDADLSFAEFGGSERLYPAPTRDGDIEIPRNYPESMARREGLEPPTLSSKTEGGARSNAYSQLQPCKGLQQAALDCT